MNDPRIVLMTAEEHAEVERLIVVLMKANCNERAARLMELSKRYLFAPSGQSALPDNVVELDFHSRKVGA